MSAPDDPGAPKPPPSPKRSRLAPAAERALAEAAARRAAAAESQRDKPPGEIGGPSGLEPTRYGDWEKKGLTSDF